jgi:hypothetical protein
MRVEGRLLGKRRGAAREGKGAKRVMKGEYDQSTLYTYIKMPS